MTMILGIDIGGSTTKITGFKDNKIISPMMVRATDPVSSMYGAFGKFIAVNRLQLSDISFVMITGVGASYINERIYQIPTGKVEEFYAIGMGGLFLSGLSKAVIVSMGTGTAFVRAEKAATCNTLAAPA